MKKYIGLLGLSLLSAHAFATCPGSVTEGDQRVKYDVKVDKIQVVEPDATSSGKPRVLLKLDEALDCTCNKDGYQIQIDPSWSGRTPTYPQGGNGDLKAAMLMSAKASDMDISVWYRAACVEGIFDGGDTVATSPASTVDDVYVTTGGLTVDSLVGKLLTVGSETSTITANTANKITVSPSLTTAPTSGAAVTISTESIADLGTINIVRYLKN